jgi:TatD DNase family protein
MIDTHVHLNFEEYIDDLNMVIMNAEDQGVEKMIVVGIDDVSSAYAVTLAEQYPNLYATVGIHPSEAHISTQFMTSFVNHPKVVAIGECGIDLHYSNDNIEEQTETFKKQIELAIEYDKPIIIHSRSAVKECLDVLKPYKGKVRGVFHCFSGTLEEADRVIDLGMYIGLDGPITFKNAFDAKALAKHIDLKHILVETDSPFLSPDPLRGRRNEPANVKYVIRALAKLKGMNVEDVDRITTDNAYALFKF